MNWINIKEQPEYGKAVLVFRKGKIPAIEIRCLHTMDATGCKFSIPYSGGQLDEFSGSVTHWMPLPEYPNPKQ